MLCYLCRCVSGHKVHLEIISEASLGMEIFLSTSDSIGNECSLIWQMFAPVGVMLVTLVRLVHLGTSSQGELRLLLQ